MSHLKKHLNTIAFLSLIINIAHAQLRDGDGNKILFYSSTDKTIDLKNFTLSNFISNYIQENPDESSNFGNGWLQTPPSRTFIIMGDTVIIDNLHIINQASKTGNLLLPFKTIGIVANTLILRGVSEFNLQGDTSLTGTAKIKSGGSVYVISNNINIEENGGLTFDLRGGTVYDVPRKWTDDPNGNGGSLFFCNDKLSLSVSEVYKMFDYFTEYYTSIFNEQYSDTKVLNEEDRKNLNLYADIIYTEMSENIQIKEKISSSTNFDIKLRKLMVDALINNLKIGLKKDAKNAVQGQGLSFFNFQVREGNVPTRLSDKGSSGQAVFYSDIYDGLVKNLFLKKIATKWLIIQLNDLQFKIQRAIQVQNKSDLYKLFLKYTQLKIYDEIDNDNNRLLVTNLLQNLNELRKTNLLPLNIQRINSDLEENIYVANVGISNNYFILPNKVALNNWSINNSDYSGIIKFTPSEKSKFEIYLTGKITSSFYSANSAKQIIELPPINGKYAGVFDKINFTDAFFGVYGINKANSYCRIVNNNVFIKLSFDESKDEDVLLTMLLNNGIPLTANWEFEEDKNYKGSIDLILKANSLFNNQVSFNQTTVTNNSRFPVIIEYLVLNDGTIKNLNPSIKIGPSQKIDFADKLQIDKTISLIPFDAINTQYTYVNNGFFPSSSNDLIKEIRIRNLMPITKNGDEIKSLKITLSWIDENNTNKEIDFDLLPKEEKTVNLFYPSEKEYKYKISGVVLYSNASYKIKDLFSSDLFISLDNSNIENN
jgi:hypothetical protein